MPFLINGFRPGSTNTGLAPRMHFYRTADAHATVDTSGYFNDVRTLLSVGDIIYVLVVNASGVVQTAGWHVVMTKTATAVDVAIVTALTLTNTD